MKKALAFLMSVVAAAVIITGCGEEATVERVDGETQASEPSATEVNWMEEKSNLTDQEQMIKSFVGQFYTTDADARDKAIEDYIHPDVQPLFHLISGFTEESEITTVDANQFAIIESMEHEEDGEVGILTLARLQDESGEIEELVFFVYEEKLGWIFSPLVEDEDMRESYHELRVLLSADTPPEELLATFEEVNNEEDEKGSSEEDTNEVGTRNNPLTIGERVSLEYRDLFYGNVQLEMEMLEVISGEEAWELVQKGNPFNDEPGDNQEYVLAKFYVKVHEVEEEPFDLNHAQFDAVSAAGNSYDDFVSVSGLEPDLWNEMYTGAEREGYTYFLVDKDDEDPLAAFMRRSDAEVWFKLR
ncbi:hypothetical protein N0O92_22610 [Alkalihalobacillus sp. MEB130]|uniref:hypothetical protein n=1 Tax=Alkalihalobacillus sp. MEB130 TaxID=2976704 RepID=UPI0028DF8ED1|nr:hypothetical protein [Alkalihalobacillus sp. MEB130]MDT8862965.1 hypothetical protein [Alkalihalobacillus sp. MEB130]